MKKKLCIMFLAVLMSVTGCGILSPDTYYIDKGMEAIDQGDYEMALQDFKAAAEEDQYLVESYRGQGMAYMALGDYENAVAAFDRAVDLTGEKQTDIRMDILMYKAAALYQLGDYESAVKVCDTMQTLGGSVDSYYLRGICYMELGEKEKAGVDFSTAVKQAPEDYDLLLNIYECYADKNLSAEGDSYLRQALAINSDDQEDAYQKARIYYFLEDYDSAKAQLNELVNEKNEKAMILMGRIYMKQDDTAHARQLYEQYIEKYGETVETYNGIVLCDIADGKYDEALAHIANGLALKEENGKQDLYFNEIVVYEKKLDFATAKEKAEAYVKAYPTDEAGLREYEFLKNR